MTDRPAPDPFENLPDDDYVLTFDPVPVKARCDGWSPLRQRRFILALRSLGVVSAAADAVGSSTQSVYKLRRRAGAASFASAWDRALGEGTALAFDGVIERALNGYEAPYFYRGKQVGTLVVSMSA